MGSPWLGGRAARAAQVSACPTAGPHGSRARQPTAAWVLPPTVRLSLPVNSEPFELSPTCHRPRLLPACLLAAWQAFEQVLAHHPEWRGKLVLVQVTSAAR